MKKLFLFFLFLSLLGCSKPKTVLICGDHVCINKLEAKQYFEENLSSEVKILNQNKNKESYRKSYYYMTGPCKTVREHSK